MSGVAPGPPPGGDQNEGPTVLAVMWTLTTVALIVFCLRIYGRLLLTRNPGWDDFWMVVAVVFDTLYTILSTVAVDFGNGRHAYYLGIEKTSKAIRMNTIAFIPGICALAWPKLSVAVLLMRLLNPSKYQRWFLYFLTTTCTIALTLCCILLWTQCTPAAGLWDPSLHPKCWKPSVEINYTLFAGAYSAFTDMYLATYPVFVFMRLNINIKKKIGLSFVMSLGLVASAIAIYKCTKLTELYDHSDYTYATVDLLIWTSVESNVIIIAACLPTLRPLFLALTGRLSTTARMAPNPYKSSGYKLSSVDKNLGGKGMGINEHGERDLHSTDDVELVGHGSEETIYEHPTPPGRIRRMVDVRIEEGTDYHDY
ncbi:MAG: hypothetical protein Q9190_000213 [Brigantiaea leucoxantha]